MTENPYKITWNILGRFVVFILYTKKKYEHLHQTTDTCVSSFLLLSCEIIPMNKTSAEIDETQ